MTNLKVNYDSRSLRLMRYKKGQKHQKEKNNYPRLPRPWIKDSSKKVLEGKKPKFGKEKKNISHMIQWNYFFSSHTTPCTEAFQLIRLIFYPRNHIWSHECPVYTHKSDTFQLVPQSELIKEIPLTVWASPYLRNVNVNNVYDVITGNVYTSAQQVKSEKQSKRISFIRTPGWVRYNPYP